ncbi:MAG: GerA spore germination protein [Paenibacillus sp.]|jgi:spore germination protein KA|nr:GerA spore germination protein [Paenibacillus sp.]
MVMPDKVNSLLSANEEALHSIFRNCSDIVSRHLQGKSGLNILLLYIDGLTNTKVLDELIIPSLIDYTSDRSFLSQYKKSAYLSEAVHSILEGKLAIFVDRDDNAYMADISDFSQRNIDEPSNESSIRGPKESFTEALRTNTSLLRRKIKNPNLKFEAYQVGTTTNTRLALSYVDGIVNCGVLDEVKKRLSGIQAKSIFDSSYIEEYIEDSPFSLFPQVMNTERPDTVAASLMHGKAAILVDGSPSVLIVPMTFWSGFQAAEDHYERFLYVGAVRILRLFLVVVSLLLPSIYVALTTFHPQMIPLNLMMSIAAAREGIPFPTVVETLLMEVMFEGLREAGLRLPKAVGSAVSIVGALVIGEAAVQAGFISAPIVMIVAGTGIASFAFPRYSLGLPLRLLRFPLLLLGGVLGFYGVAMGVVFILIHLITLKSFGVPYLKPTAPFNTNALKDTWIRMHRRLTKKLPN